MPITKILKSLPLAFQSWKDVKTSEGNIITSKALHTLSKVQFLLFAEDLVLVAENEEDIKRNAEVLNEVMKNGR